MITPAQRAEIRRLFYGEHWKVGTIAAQLGIHHETVRAAVEREAAGVRPSLCRPSILDPYLVVGSPTVTDSTLTSGQSFNSLGYRSRQILVSGSPTRASGADRCGPRHGLTSP